MNRNLKFILFFFSTILGTTLGTQRPIIGILTIPVEEKCVTYIEPPQNLDGSIGSCFWTVYAKWIESAGARPAVIPYDASNEELNRLFKGINGLLYTGGGSSLKIRKTATYLYNLALEENNNGTYFPIWGTCLGMQVLARITAQDQSILCLHCFDSQDISLPLDFTNEASNSRLFKNASQLFPIKQIFSQENITENLHTSGFKPKLFYSNKKLNDFYRVISTNKDRKGLEFVSTIEGKNVPIYGTQWHPERYYEWRSTYHISHDYDAVLAMQYTANFFVNEARKNNHKFSSGQEESDALVYNYKTTPYSEGCPSCQFYMIPPQKTSI